MGRSVVPRRGVVEQRGLLCSAPMTSEPDRVRLARPELGKAELEAVARVLESGMLVQGATVERFERAIAERVGRKHAIAVSSGTNALELAIEALDLRGKRVAVPALTWPSPAHAALGRGAVPVLVDVHASEWNVSSETLAAVPKVAALIAIDQFGVPARHGELASVPVIEDAACAIGSTLDGRACGSFGLVSCLSFHPRKVLTTGEGGMCLTDDGDLAARIRMLRNHGQRAAGVFDEASGNHRLTELAAAIGLVQLSRLDRALGRRRAIAEHYRTTLASLDGLSVQTVPPGARRNEQTFGVLAKSTMQRDALVTALGGRGIESGKLSYALHRLPSLAGAERAGTLGVAEDVVDRGLALPLHSCLVDEEVQRVVEAVREAFAEVSA
jgi:perosamine synthetase